MGLCAPAECNCVINVLDSTYIDLGRSGSGSVADPIVITASLAVTAWTHVTFQNSWVDYNTATYGFTSYRKVGDMVQLRGAIKTGTASTVAFTLPAGFRPPARVDVPAIASGIAAADVAVLADGTVTPIGTGVNVFCSILAEFSVTS